MRPVVKHGGQGALGDATSHGARVAVEQLCHGRDRQQRRDGDDRGALEGGVVELELKAAHDAPAIASPCSSTPADDG